MSIHRLKIATRIALVIACALPHLSAQVERASISGIISDETGAPLAQASVSADNLATSVNTSTLTNATGNFYLMLPPGDYRIVVSQSGFTSATVPKLSLSVAQAATLNLSLNAGSVRQEVTVKDISPLLEQESASLGSTIQSQQI